MPKNPLVIESQSCKICQLFSFLFHTDKHSTKEKQQQRHQQPIILYCMLNSERIKKKFHIKTVIACKTEFHLAKRVLRVDVCLCVDVYSFYVLASN